MSETVSECMDEVVCPGCSTLVWKRLFREQEQLCDACYAHVTREGSLYIEKRALLHRVMMNHPCNHCGETNPELLRPVWLKKIQQHLSPHISQLVRTSYSPSRLVAELNKCGVLCDACVKLLRDEEITRDVLKPIQLPMLPQRRNRIGDREAMIQRTFRIGPSVGAPEPAPPTTEEQVPFTPGVIPEGTLDGYGF